VAPVVRCPVCRVADPFPGELNLVKSRSTPTGVWMGGTQESAIRLPKVVLAHTGAHAEHLVWRRRGRTIGHYGRVSLNQVAAFYSPRIDNIGKS
jgi:hypothetical protein